MIRGTTVLPLYFLYLIKAKINNQIKSFGFPHLQGLAHRLGHSEAVTEENAVYLLRV
jgi:hypothetical protein